MNIDSRFGLIFYDSSLIDLHFEFNNCVVELGNLLYHFGKLNCKNVILSVDSLRFKYLMPTQEMMNDFQYQHVGN